MSVTKYPEPLSIHSPGTNRQFASARRPSFKRKRESHRKSSIFRYLWMLVSGMVYHLLFDFLGSEKTSRHHFSGIFELTPRHSQLPTQHNEDGFFGGSILAAATQPLKTGPPFFLAPRGFLVGRPDRI